MLSSHPRRIHRIYGVLLSITLLITGILLICACIGIYNSGDKPFTPESVAAAFSTIALPVYICVGLIVGGLALDGFAPDAPAKLHPHKELEGKLAKLYGKFPLSAYAGQWKSAIVREQTRRKRNRIITLVLLCICGALFLMYGMNPANYHQSQITESMTKAVLILAAAMVPPLAMAIYTVCTAPKSIEKEIELVRKAMAETPEITGQTETPSSRKRFRLSPRWAILCIGIAILIYGFLAGGTNDVLTKAVNICTECVGLG